MLARAGPSLTRAFSTTSPLAKQQRRQKPFSERRGGFGLRRDEPDSSTRPERDTSSFGAPRGQSWRSAVDHFRAGENPPRRGFGLRASESDQRPDASSERERERELQYRVERLDQGAVDEFPEPTQLKQGAQTEQAVPAGQVDSDPEQEPSLQETSKSKRRASAPTSALTPAWQPTKKLTFAAMAGLRELHAQDPETFTPTSLAKTFGVSREAVTRILRSKFRSQTESSSLPPSLKALEARPGPNNRPQGLNATIPGANVRGDAAMGKWAALARENFSPQVAEAARRWDAGTSPVPAIRRAFEMRRRAEAESNVPEPQVGGVERRVVPRPMNRAQRRRERAELGGRGKDGE